MIPSLDYTFPTTRLSRKTTGLPSSLITDAIRRLELAVNHLRLHDHRWTRRRPLHRADPSIFIADDRSATATDVRAATADDDLVGDATTAVSNLHRPICY